MTRVDSPAAKASASEAELSRTKHVMLKYMFMQDVADNKHTTLTYVNTKANNAYLMTKCHGYDAHMHGCALFGLKLNANEK